MNLQSVLIVLTALIPSALLSEVCPCNKLKYYYPRDCVLQDCIGYIEICGGSYDVRLRAQLLYVKIYLFKNITTKFHLIIEQNMEQFASGFKSEIIQVIPATYILDFNRCLPHVKRKEIDMYNEQDWTLSFGDDSMETRKWLRFSAFDLPFYRMRYLDCCFKNYGNEGYNLYVKAYSKKVEFSAIYFPTYVKELVVLFEQGKLKVQIKCNVLNGQVNAVIFKINQLEDTFGIPIMNAMASQAFVFRRSLCVWDMYYTYKTSIGEFNMAKNETTVFLIADKGFVHYTTIKF